MSPKQLLLHIGTDKTGTTSIQETLHRAAEEGALGGICYPLFKRRNHNFTATLYKPFDRLPRTYRMRYQELGDDALERDAKEFREELFNWIRESQKTILSAEYLSRFASDEVTALGTDLAQLGIDEILVVVYVRNPASHYLSNVQQTLKAASTYVSPAIWRHPIHGVLRAWSKQFSNLVVRPFAEDQLVGGDAVSDFLHVASSFFGVDDGLDLPAFVENQSISAEGMIVLQQYRQRFYSSAEDEYQRDSNQLLQMLLRSMSIIDQTRPKLIPSVEQAIVKRHQRDLEHLLGEYGVDLRGDLADGVADSDPGMELHQGERRWSDLSLILDSYDEDIVEELLLYCVREGLNSQQEGSPKQISNLKARISDLERALESYRGDTEYALEELRRVKKRFDETLASRSWRWGHRIALFLSSPRRLIRKIRRGGRR